MRRGGGMDKIFVLIVKKRRHVIDDKDRLTRASKRVGPLRGQTSVPSRRPATPSYSLSVSKFHSPPPSRDTILCAGGGGGRWNSAHTEKSRARHTRVRIY